MLIIMQKYVHRPVDVYNKASESQQQTPAERRAPKLKLPYKEKRQDVCYCEYQTQSQTFLELILRPRETIWPYSTCTRLPDKPQQMLFTVRLRAVHDREPCGDNQRRQDDKLQRILGQPSAGAQLVDSRPKQHIHLVQVIVNQGVHQRTQHC